MSCRFISVSRPCRIAPSQSGRGLIRILNTYEKSYNRWFNRYRIPKISRCHRPRTVFIIANEKVQVGVFTDIGFACRHVIHHFEQCNAAFLETNYDVQMLATGPYPPALQNRIRSGKGHLSNLQAMKLFIEHRPAFMSHLILSHLSRTNNKPSIVEELFRVILRAKTKNDSSFTK